MEWVRGLKKNERLRLLGCSLLLDGGEYLLSDVCLFAFGDYEAALVAVNSLSGDVVAHLVFVGGVVDYVVDAWGV